MRINDSSIIGIFKYSPDIIYEKGDFVVEGECIYICKSSEGISGVSPSTSPDYYSEYPGERITSAQEYYDYIRDTSSGQMVDDKYVSAHVLCEILENMYFGFGDNGLVSDHIIYTSNGIDYCVRSDREVLDNASSNVLNRVLSTNDLNNGLIRVSRNLPEIVSDLFLDIDPVSSDDVVILKQYTYLNSTGQVPFRVQELLDPKYNKIYFRFARGERDEDGNINFLNADVTRWRSLYNSDHEIINKLDAVENYYQNLVEENNHKVDRLFGKYCYRSVEGNSTNNLGSSTVVIRPGTIRDIKAVESFVNRSCVLNILIKKNPISSDLTYSYTVTIDMKDICSALNYTETYYITDDITIQATYNGNELDQVITLVVPSSCIIKDIFYRDYTLGHEHNWVTQEVISTPDCTTPGERIEVCQTCGETRRIVTPPLGHDTVFHPRVDPTCTDAGSEAYYTCNHENPSPYYTDETCTSVWNDIVIPPISGGGHVPGDWETTTEATCTQPGEEVKKCTICSTILETRTTPALGHNYLQHLAVQPSDCGHPGREAYCTCSRCDGIFDSSHNPLSSVDDVPIIYPSGNHSTAEYHDQTVIPISQSDNNDRLDIANGIFPQHGIELRECANCENLVECPTDFVYYDFSSAISEVSIQPTYSVIDGITYHIPGGRRGTFTGGVVKTNYDWSSNNYVSARDQLLNHVISNDQHAIYHQPTDTSPGYWEGTCSVCGATNVKEYDWSTYDPSKHILHDPDHTITTGAWHESTCNTNAYWEGICDDCGERVVVPDEDHKAIGHRDEVPANGICDICGDPLY